jgi:hypothetical protein
MREEGNKFCTKQTEDQLVPIAIVINVVVRKSRLIKDGNAVAGLLVIYEAKGNTVFEWNDM